MTTIYDKINDCVKNGGVVLTSRFPIDVTLWSMASHKHILDCQMTLLETSAVPQIQPTNWKPY